MKLVATICSSLGLLVFGGLADGAGTYREPGIDSASAQLRAWGSLIVAYRPAPGMESNSSAPNALGSRDGSTVSLGDLTQDQLDAGMSSGTITLRFDDALRDGPGWDLAVFENAFAVSEDHLFAELGFVEVSTDGVTFARFPSVSLSRDRLELPTTVFSGIDPTDVYNLAGKHPGDLGTPFDFGELAPHPSVVSGNVRLQSIHYVRIVDIPGSASWESPLRNVDGDIAFSDSLGNPILDPWNTASTGVGGFDLDAIGGRYVRDAGYAEVLLANMFQTGTDYRTGDLNGDGTTDAADLNLWNAIDFVDPRPASTIVPEASGSRWAVPVLALGMYVLARLRQAKLVL